MLRSAGLAHIIRAPDGTSEGAWGPYVLKTAFQPIFAFRDGRLSVAAFEGLLRPFRNGEPISPPAFFQTVAAGDRFHVETLSRTLHLLNAGVSLDPDVLVFINFDPSLFCDREIVATALREMRLVLNEAHIDPARVVCEVTEKKSGSQQALIGFVQALRAHGFKVAVDDYGSEDSDMERVAILKPDIVKFDAQWITRLMDSSPGQALLSLMVTGFAQRGISTVFEGIEEGWQLELAEEAGASMVQGYVLARPELAPTSFATFRSRRPAAATNGAAPAPVKADAPPPPRLPSGGRSFGRRGAPQP